MFNPANIQLSVTKCMQVWRDYHSIKKVSPLFMPITFEVGNIPVAKFAIVDSFLAHFIITISDLPYSDILSSTDNHVCSHH